MKDIIDEVSSSAPKAKKTFSKLSFVIAIINVSMIVSLFQTTLTWNLNRSIGWDINPVIIAALAQVSILLGIILSILSFVEKEPNSIYKWLGSILNVFIFLIAVGSIIFVIN